MQEDFSTRPLLQSDQQQIWNWLHIALWDPPPAGLRPREILENPHVRIYAENWGKASDVGVVGQVAGADVGACWMRLLPAGVGLAYVDESTPQLGIALIPEYQNRRLGQPLMLAALQAAREHGYRQISLTVHPQNPAIKLSERCSFEHRGDRNTYRLMVASI